MTTYFLMPVNGASKHTLQGALTFQDCLSQQALFRKGSIPQLATGTHICLLTNQGHMSGITVKSTQVEKTGIASVRLFIIVWSAGSK
jgi:hypothetical protein